MPKPIIFVQIVFAVFLIIAILFQSRGTGLGQAWGGGTGSYSTRRGVEKLLFRITILLAIGFLLTSVISLFL